MHMYDFGLTCGKLSGSTTAFLLILVFQRSTSSMEGKGVRAHKHLCSWKEMHMTVLTM